MKTESLIRISLLAMASLAFITCKKNDDNPKSCKVVKIAIPVAGADTSFINYTYDAGGRLIKSDFGDGLYTTYTFETTEVTAKTYTDNTLNYTEVYTLDSEGRAISSTYALAGAAVSKTIAYEYNSDGFLSSKVTTQVSNSKYDTYSYVYENGNLVDETHEYSDADFSSTDKTYEYYTDKSNNFDLKVSIMGKKSANLLKKTIYTIYSNTNFTSKPYSIVNFLREKSANPDVVINTLYTYEFGSDGKVIKQTTTIGNSPIINIPYYECN